MKKLSKVLSIIIFLAVAIVACREFTTEMPLPQGGENSTRSRALNNFNF